MDAERFDLLAKTVFASSRRGLLGAVFGGVLGWGGLAQAVAQNCKALGQPCGTGSECCSQRCDETCICQEIGEFCEVGPNCCKGTCQGNICRCQGDSDCVRGAHCCNGTCHECCTREHCASNE